MASYAFPVSNLRSQIMGPSVFQPASGVQMGMAPGMAPAGQPGAPGSATPGQPLQNILGQRAGWGAPPRTQPPMLPAQGFQSPGMGSPGQMQPPMMPPTPMQAGAMPGQPGMPAVQSQMSQMQPQNAFAQRAGMRQVM